MVARRNIRKFAKKLEDGAGVWSTKEQRRIEAQDPVQDVAQKFSGFAGAPAHPPMSWWQRRKQRKKQEREAKSKNEDDEDDEMPKKSTREKLDEIFDIHDEEEDADRDDGPVDVFVDGVEEDDDEEDEEPRHKTRPKKSSSLPSSKQKASKQEKHLNDIEESIKKKEQELARLMKEERAEKAEIKRQKKELKRQRKTLKGAARSAPSATRHPIVTGFLMALGFVLFFALIAGIIYAITIATGRPFNEFIRLVIKV